MVGAEGEESRSNRQPAAISASAPRNKPLVHSASRFLADARNDRKPTLGRTTVGAHGHAPLHGDPSRRRGLVDVDRTQLHVSGDHRPEPILRYTGIAVIEGIAARLAEYRPQRIERDGMPRAAVLIPLYEKDATHHIILQVRTELVLHHKGQISFPGGAEDPGDTDLMMTALRETEEEIGLAREDVEVLGQLDDIITVSDFIVTPYVGRVTHPAPYPFAPSGFEVAELLEVPLPHLHDRANVNTEPSPWRDRLVPPPSYQFGEHVIWGATARLLGKFLDVAVG